MSKLRRLSSTRIANVTSSDSENVIKQLSEELGLVSHREEVIKLFHDFSERLLCIPVSDADVTLEQAILDIKRERIQLNGVHFYGHDEMTLATLRLLCSRCMEATQGRTSRSSNEADAQQLTTTRNSTSRIHPSSNQDIDEEEKNQVYDSIVKRASRTATGGDCLFLIHHLFSRHFETAQQMLIKTLPCAKHECLQVLLLM